MCEKFLKVRVHEKCIWSLRIYTLNVILGTFQVKQAPLGDTGTIRAGYWLKIVLVVFTVYYVVMMYPQWDHREQAAGMQEPLWPLAVACIAVRDHLFCLTELRLLYVFNIDTHRATNTRQFSKLDKPKMQSSATVQEEMASSFNCVAGGALYSFLHTAASAFLRLPFPVYSEAITLHYKFPLSPVNHITSTDCISLLHLL